MTKDVIIGISGLQFTGEENAESLEVIAPGQYYYRDGKHYVKYEEVVEGFEEKNENLVKIGPRKVEVTKKGLTNVHMVFEEKKKNVTCYTTPFGNLMIGIKGNGVSIREEEKNILVKADYTLDINYEYVADCSIRMHIRARDGSDFSLMEM